MNTVTSDHPRTTRSGFLDSLQRFPDRPALEIEGRALSYQALYESAATLAATLDACQPNDEPTLTAVFAHRSFTAFAGVLAALLRGHGYVPLNPGFPTERTRSMLSRSSCRSLIVDAAACDQLDELLDGLPWRLTILVPDATESLPLEHRWPQHRFLTGRSLQRPQNWRPAPADPNSLAYLLFTSGSTGIPKGVMVAHRNVTHFVEAMAERYAVTEHDRFSQTFDLTFDLSAFDMFVAWARGACLCCPTQQQKLLPGKYIKDAALTVWFSVPSTAVLMSRLRMLKAGHYPNLRLSLFCGEALPVDIVHAWTQAAPNAIVENLYGPTELTIACTLYRWDAARSPEESELGVVPIGTPYPGMETLVTDESLEEVAPGETGELIVTGPQLSLGYWQDPAKTAASFVRPPGKDAIYYRTGDRVRRPRRLDAPLVYLGRMDNQIKVQGYRVELGEVEAALREEAGVDMAVAIGWPSTPSGADGIVGFLAAREADTERIMTALRSRLPAYMQIRDLKLLPDFPLNANGKVDRGALRGMLEAGR